LFMPLRKEKWTLYSDFAGAFCNLSLNFILITWYGALGAAIASVIAELVVTSVQIFLARKYISAKKIMVSFVNYLVMSLIMGMCVYLASLISAPSLIKLVAGIFVGVIVYVIELIVVKNQWAILGISMVKTRFNSGTSGK